MSAATKSIPLRVINWNDSLIGRYRSVAAAQRAIDADRAAVHRANPGGPLLLDYAIQIRKEWADHMRQTDRADAVAQLKHELADVSRCD